MRKKKETIYTKLARLLSVLNEADERFVRLLALYIHILYS